MKRMSVATPNPDTNIESVLSTCLNCAQPVVSVKLNAGAEWSQWAHAMNNKVECDTSAPTPPGTTERSN